MFDAIILVMLSFGFATGITALSNYDKKSESVKSYYSHYEEVYGVDFDITEEDFEKLTDEAKQVFQDAYKALQEDVGFQKATQKLFYLTLFIFSAGIFLSYLLWYFILPLFFGYGRTLGKKIFGLAVIRTNGVKASNPVLFIRIAVGMFAMETLLPLSMLVMIWFDMMGVIGLITIGLIALLEIGVLIYTKTNSSIHDLLTDTVVVDYVSQQIFETQDDLLAYQQEEHKKSVKKAEYDRLENKKN